MQTHTTSSATPKARLPRDPGLPGLTLVSFTTAGAVLLGGYFVGGMTMLGRLSGHGVLLSSAALYVTGAVAGLLLGTVLALAGRPAGMRVREAVGGWGLGLLYAVPALLVTFLPAGWAAMVRVALYLGRPLPLALTAVAMLVGLIPLAAAAKYGLAATRNAVAGLRRLAAR